MAPATCVCGGVFDLGTDSSPHLSHPFLPARTLSYKPSFLLSWVDHLPADKAWARALCYPVGALPSDLPQKWTRSLWLIARPATEDTNYCDPIPKSI